MCAGLILKIAEIPLPSAASPEQRVGRSCRVVADPRNSMPHEAAQPLPRGSISLRKSRSSWPNVRCTFRFRISIPSCSRPMISSDIRFALGVRAAACSVAARLWAYLLEGHSLPGFIGIEPCHLAGLQRRTGSQILFVNHSFVIDDQSPDSGYAILRGPGH